MDFFLALFSFWTFSTITNNKIEWNNQEVIFFPPFILGNKSLSTCNVFLNNDEYMLAQSLKNNIQAVLFKLLGL